MSRLHYSPFVGTGGRLQLETPQDPEDETASPAGAFLLVEFGEDGLSVDEVDEDTAALAVANIPGFSMQGAPSAPSGKSRSKKSAPPTETPVETPVEPPSEPTPEAPEAPPAEPPVSEPPASNPESATTPTEVVDPAEGGSETTHPEGEPASSADAASSTEPATPAEPAQG
jgi:outer membrane biosynthesis protein TonB